MIYIIYINIKNRGAGGTSKYIYKIFHKVFLGTYNLHKLTYFFYHFYSSIFISDFINLIISSLHLCSTVCGPI